MAALEESIHALGGDAANTVESNRGDGQGFTLKVLQTFVSYLIAVGNVDEFQVLHSGNEFHRLVVHSVVTPRQLN